MELPKIKLYFPKKKKERCFQQQRSVLTNKILCVYIYIYKISYLKELESEEQMKPKVSRRSEIINIRAEIDESDQKRQQKRSMNLNACFLKR